MGSSDSGMGWMLLLTLFLDHGVPAHTPAALWLTSFFQKEGMAILIFILNNLNNFRKEKADLRS